MLSAGGSQPGPTFSASGARRSRPAEGRGVVTGHGRRRTTAVAHGCHEDMCPGTVPRPCGHLRGPRDRSLRRLPAGGRDRLQCSAPEASRFVASLTHVLVAAPSSPARHVGAQEVTGNTTQTVAPSRWVGTIADVGGLTRPEFGGTDPPSVTTAGGPPTTALRHGGTDSAAGTGRTTAPAVALRLFAQRTSRCRVRGRSRPAEHPRTPTRLPATAPGTRRPDGRGTHSARPTRRCSAAPRSSTPDPPGRGTSSRASAHPAPPEGGREGCRPGRGRPSATASTSTNRTDSPERG